MGDLNEIKNRHGRDRIKDALFICAALVLTAVSIGSVTSKAAGKPRDHHWSVKVVDPISLTEIAR